MTTGRVLPIFVLFSATVLSPLKACAGWANTKWGMSPKEVIHVYKGKLTKDETSQTVVYEGEYRAGDFHFYSRLVFNDDGLIRVVLSASSEFSCDGILDGLRDKYGDGQNRSISMREPSYSWDDRKNSNRVKFEDRRRNEMAMAAGISPCIIVYEKLSYDNGL